MKKILSILIFLTLVFINNAYAPELPPRWARQLKTDTTNFNNNLSASDTDLQKVADTVDNLTITGAPTSATYLTSTLNTTLTAEVDLGLLSTGLLKGTVAGGISTISSITDSSTNWDTAYTHSQDNTQAHSDYMLNSGDTATGTYDFTGATVNVATPTASANAATKDYVDLAVQSHELTEYFSAVADVLGGIYYIMDTTQAAAGTASTTALTNNNNQTVLKFITPIALPNLATIFAGIYDAHIHTYKSGVTTGKVVTARWKMYRRLAAPSTTEDLIMTSEDILVTSTSSATPQIANPHAILASDFALTADLSDRLVIYWEVDVSGGGVSVIFNIVVGGTVDSQVCVSIPAAELNQIYVNVTGDTMTGALTINDNNAAGSTLLTIGDATDADSVAIFGDLTVTGGDITLGTSAIFSGGDTTSLNLIDALDNTTESTIEAAIDTLANLTGLNLSQTNMTAGRSLTISTNDVYADAETYIYKAKIAFENPVAGDDFFFDEVLPSAVTFTKIYAKTLVGTVDFDITVAGADINGTDITATTSGVLDETLGGDTTGAVGDEIKLEITSVASTPTYIMVILIGTYDD